MTDLRHCIGSSTFGIEAHEAPVTEFPTQPSQRDGLGRMCKPHWNQYTRALARDRKARLVPAGEGAAVVEKLRASAKAKASGTRARKAGAPEPIRTKAPRAPRHAKVAQEASPE